MYLLKITEEDKNALLNLINNGRITGADAPYIVGLQQRIINAPTEGVADDAQPVEST